MSSIYSPVHALLWFVVNPSNWMISVIVMCMTSAQVRLGHLARLLSSNDAYTDSRGHSSLYSPYQGQGDPRSRGYERVQYQVCPPTAYARP